MSCGLFDVAQSIASSERSQVSWASGGTSTIVGSAIDVARTGKMTT